MSIHIKKQNIENITKLNFAGCDDIVDFHKLITTLTTNNPKCENGVICFLYCFIGYNPTYFPIKHKKDSCLDKGYEIDNIDEVIATLNDILPNIPNRTLKCKIATYVLIENCNGAIDKPNLANVIIENAICFMDKLFTAQSYELSYNLLFAIDLANKFGLDERFSLTRQIKEKVIKYLDDNESINMDFQFINFFKNIFLQFKNFWERDELNDIKNKLDKIAESKINQLDSIGNISQRQVKKMVICEIYGLVVIILEKYMGETKEIQAIYKKIIDLNLKFADNIDDYGIKAEALQCALYFANKLKDKKQIKAVNKRIQGNNNEMLKNQQKRHIPLNIEQKNLLNQYKDIVNAVVEKHNDLFAPFAICFNNFFKIDFSKLEQESNFRNALMGTIIFDHHGLIKNIDNKDGIFVEYSYLLQWYSILTYELKDKLLKKFYPNKQYFLSLAYNNNIIPKGYEEIIARMFYAGMHNDNMDFLIYASVSIEGILRHILEKNDCGTIKNNKKNKHLQEYETLENMLETIQNEKLLDDDLIRELRLLFCREGFNIRNEVAHSKFSQDIFDGYSWLVNYMWCFMMNFFIKHYK